MDTFRNYANEAENELIGQVRRSMNISEPKELGFPSEITESYSEEDRKKKRLRQPRQAM